MALIRTSYYIGSIMLQTLTNSGYIIGRILLASLFILGGINKLQNYGDTLALMEQAGLAPANVLLPLVIALELGGGLIVATGFRFMPQVALALALFTLATNVVFHQFWSMAGPEAALQLSLFFKNIAISGALLHVAMAALKKAE
jgi:putative oxidoreductase